MAADEEGIVEEVGGFLVGLSCNFETKIFKIAIRSFLVRSVSLPDMFFSKASPSSLYNPTFSLLNLKMNKPIGSHIPTPS